MGRGSRGGVWAIVAVAVLLLIALGLDIGAKAVAERRVAAMAVTSLDLSERPAVSIEGFPFLIRLADGSVPSLELRATTFRTEGLDVESATVTLEDVTFSATDLLSGSGSVTAASGSGTMRLTGGAVTEVVQARGFPVTVRFEGRRAFLQGSTGPEVEAQVSLSEGTVFLRPVEPSFAEVSFILPQIAPDIRFTEGRVAGGRAVMEFELTDTTFEAA